MDLKRDYIKYIRDRAKARYTETKGSDCFICGTTEELQFHHFYSVATLAAKWIKENGHKKEDVELWRDEFIDIHQQELYNEVVTLCKKHHMDGLHRVYTRTPAPSTAEKQKRWCQKQRDKFYNVESI